MDEATNLLDTPKRAKLQTEANSLKTALKDFERAFASEHNGQKPGRDDIKSNADISNKYSKYQKLRDVIAGKLGLEALEALPPQAQQRRSRSRKHERTDSAISLTPHRTRHVQTPSKDRYHPSQLDPYDAPNSASPKIIPSAVGPTPHRDGTILGIFDMLSASGGSRKDSQNTPSGSKRKAHFLDDDADERQALHGYAAQTPSQRRKRGLQGSGDHLPMTTPRSGRATGKRNHSKTPVSESKRFMLEHFFATPSAVRFATMMQDEGDANARTPIVKRTPLRDQVLGLSASKTTQDGQHAMAAIDATPPYLKRSFSFKERLLSATGTTTSPSSSSRLGTSPASTRNLGPRRLQHARFVPKPLSQMIADRASQQRQEGNAEEEHDDDMDALREMEEEDVNVLVGDSQMNNRGPNAPGGQPEPRTWKKKGQKRTTRRAIIRPTKMKAAEAPKFVAVEDPATNENQIDEQEVDERESTTEVSQVDETQFAAVRTGDFDNEPDDADLEYLIAEAEQAGEEEERYSLSKTVDHEDTVPDGESEDGEAAFFPAPSPSPSLSEEQSPVKRQKPNKPQASRESRPDKADKPRRSKSNNTNPSLQDGVHGARKINPNAHSHMNFRSLKIRNKNSKAKGAGRGFGRLGRNKR